MTETEIQDLNDIITHAIQRASDSEILELAFDDTGIAVFPKVGRVVIDRDLRVDKNPIPSHYWADIEFGGNGWGHGVQLNLMVGDPDNPEGRSVVELRNEMLAFVAPTEVADCYEAALQSEDQ